MKSKRIVCDYCKRPAAYVHHHAMGPPDYSCPDHGPCGSRQCQPLEGNGTHVDKYEAGRRQAR